MTAASLHQLVIRSPRPEHLDEWYREALGLEGPPCLLDGGPMAVRMERSREHPDPSREPMRLIPNFVIDDVAPVERRLIGLGAPWVRELEATSWGRIATVVDPDGNYLQLFEVPGPDDRPAS